MDRFLLLLDGVSVSAQGALHIAFTARLTGSAAKVRYFAAYLFLIFCIGTALPGVCAVGAELAALYGVLRLQNGRAAAGSAAVLAVYISQLAFGAVNSVEAALFPAYPRRLALYLLLLLATLAALALCAGCYALALRLLPPEEYGGTPHVGLLLPGLFCFAAELYIARTAYSGFTAGRSMAVRGGHLALLILQLMGLGALLCTLYACRRICRGFRTQAALDSLRQAARAQQTCVEEARQRYEGTRAFRHDVRNHLAVVRGLLERGESGRAKRYLDGLEAVSDALAFPCRTGSPVLDVLLGEKLGLAAASGIAAEVSLALPGPCAADDLDLCILFANAVDNASAACRAAGGDAHIRISGERQGDFWRLEFENTCAEGPLPPEGTGLANIRAVAEKYHGAVLAEKSGPLFRLHVLLDISIPFGDSSVQGPCNSTGNG